MEKFNFELRGLMNLVLILLILYLFLYRPWQNYAKQQAVNACFEEAQIEDYTESYTTDEKTGKQVKTTRKIKVPENYWYHRCMKEMGYE